MTCFQITLKGWQPEDATSETELCIKWVNAPTREHLDHWLKSQGYTDLVQEIDTDLPQHYTFEDGVDLVIQDDGTCKWGHQKEQQDWDAQVQKAKLSSVLLHRDRMNEAAKAVARLVYREFPDVIDNIATDEGLELCQGCFMDALVEINRYKEVETPEGINFAVIDQ